MLLESICVGSAEDGSEADLQTALKTSLDVEQDGKGACRMTSSCRATVLRVAGADSGRMQNLQLEGKGSSDDEGGGWWHISPLVTSSARRL